MIHVRPREDKNNVISVVYTENMQMFVNRVNRYFLDDNLPAKMKGGTFDVPDPIAENRTYNVVAMKQRVVRIINSMNKHIQEVSNG